MTLDEGGEGGFGRFARAGEELAQELLVGPHHDIVKVPNCSDAPRRRRCLACHRLDPLGVGVGFYT